MGRRAKTAHARWLLLIHQIPPKPAYFRAKVGKRLAKLGAVAIKNSVYVLPLSDAAQEDFEWVAREIVTDGGEATLCKAELVEGLRDDQIEALFHAARDADYAAIADEARALAKGVPSRLGGGDARRAQIETEAGRLRKRLGEIAAIDFFAAPGRVAASAAIEALERRVRPSDARDGDESRTCAVDYRGRTWVTRKNVHVDRIACAWLIKRFVDRAAKVKLVPAQGYRAKPGEVTFDMFEADFTHEGDRCSFETIVARFDLREAGLAPIAEIVHEIDVKDGKFARHEAPGIAALIAGIALANADDEARIELGSRVFDALFELYKRRRS